jgi:methionyl-tRNA synthetase
MVATRWWMLYDITSLKMPREPGNKGIVNLPGKVFADYVKGELVDAFGNFVNRALYWMHKLCKGKVPPLLLIFWTMQIKNMFADT